MRSIEIKLFLLISSKLLHEYYANTIDNHLGVFARHQLLQPHKLARTHHLLEYWNKERGDGLAKYVSRPIGCSIPRPNTGMTYAIFSLAHFKPFSVTNPLLREGETFDNVFKKYQFTDSAKLILDNWDAINECEDARDAERIKKRAAMTTQSQALTKCLFFDEMDIPLVDPSESASFSTKKDFAVNQHMLLLEQSKWLTSSFEISPPDLNSFVFPIVTDVLLKEWTKAIRHQEKFLAQLRQNKSDISTQKIA